MTFSHEVGHNFGAIHDDDTPSSMHDCREKTYIMSSTGSSEKNLQFSRCSLQNMSLTLNDVSHAISICFVKETIFYYAKVIIKHV